MGSSNKRGIKWSLFYNLPLNGLGPLRIILGSGYVWDGVDEPSVNLLPTGFGRSWDTRPPTGRPPRSLEGRYPVDRLPTIHDRRVGSSVLWVYFLDTVDVPTDTLMYIYNIYINFHIHIYIYIMYICVYI